MKPFSSLAKISVPLILPFAGLLCASTVLRRVRVGETADGVRGAAENSVETEAEVVMKKLDAASCDDGCVAAEVESFCERFSGKAAATEWDCGLIDVARLTHATFVIEPHGFSGLVNSIEQLCFIQETNR
jgi:hypothetical protein